VLKFAIKNKASKSLLSNSNSSLKAKRKSEKTRSSKKKKVRADLQAKNANANLETKSENYKLKVNFKLNLLGLGVGKREEKKVSEEKYEFPRSKAHRKECNILHHEACLEYGSKQRVELCNTIALTFRKSIHMRLYSIRENIEFLAWKFNSKFQLA
jgi:hypothetical protein